MSADFIHEYNEFPGEMFQVMDENGAIKDQARFDEVGNEKLVDFYKWMIKIRTVDTRGNNLQRVGRLGTYPSTYGQEACQVGAGLALRKEDWLVPTFRETGMMWCFGVPIHMTFMYWAGNENGSKMPDDVNCLPISITVGGHIPHATGIAWANKLQKKPGVAFASFSDGATSEGDFHAGLNFAGVLKLPAVFFVQNNEYAISTPTSLQTASKTFAQKAFSYGMKAILVDGNDVVATYLACQKAIEVAEKEQTPVLIDAVTYRLGNHTSSDNAKLYREDSEVESWMPKEPVIRVRKYLEAQGLWDDAKQQQLEEESAAAADKMVDDMKAAGLLDPRNMMKYLYAEMTPQLQKQHDEFVEELTQMNSDRI